MFSQRESWRLAGASIADPDWPHAVAELRRELTDLACARGEDEEPLPFTEVVTVQIAAERAVVAVEFYTASPHLRMAWDQRPSGGEGPPDGWGRRRLLPDLRILS